MRMNSIMKLTSLLVVLYSLLSLQLFAQTRSVGGRVTDQNGAGVPGVTVTVRGTSNSTQTASDGTYRINAADDAVLVFTSVGYTTQELPVSGRSTVDVSFVASANNLNDLGSVS